MKQKQYRKHYCNVPFITTKLLTDLYIMTSVSSSILFDKILDSQIFRLTEVDKVNLPK